MAIMLEPLDQARYHSTDHMLRDGGQQRSSNVESLPLISSSSPKVSKTRIPRPSEGGELTPQVISSSSPKVSKTRIPRPSEGGELTPQFSIKRISELKEGPSREKKKGRKYSDDFETRRRQQTVDPSKMKSVSLEKLSNESGVWYCVRGSQERQQKASSVSQPVDRTSNQTAKLHRNAAYPRVYKHQPKPIVHPQKQPNKGYAAMHSAKQALKEKAQIRAERKVEKIYKQTDDNRRRESGYNMPANIPDRYQNNLYPHTLPSAMYPPPHPAEYPGLYEPPVIDQPLKPLPPISAQYEDSHNMNMGSTQPEPASSPYESSSPPPSQAKTNSYAKPERLKITYKPYGLREYNTMKAGFGAKAGGLGPDTDSDEYKKKLARTNRKLEYAERIREKHHQKEFMKKKAPEQYQPPSKTVLGQEYARTIARPRVTKYRQLEPLEHLPNKPEYRSSQDVIAEKLLMNMHHRKIMSDLGQII